MARELSENMLLLVLQRISEYLGVPSDVLDAIKIELMNIFSFIVLRGLRCHINKKESKLMLKFNVDPGAPDERRGSKSASNLDIEDGTRILLAMQEASELLMKHESFSKRVEKGDIMSKVIAFECDVDGSDLCVSLIFDDVSNLKKAFDFLLGIINLGFRHHECDELKGPVHPIPVPAPGRG